MAAYCDLPYSDNGCPNRVRYLRVVDRTVAAQVIFGGLTKSKTTGFTIRFAPESRHLANIVIKGLLINPKQTWLAAALPFTEPEELSQFPPRAFN